MPRILALNQASQRQSALATAAEALRRGDIVAMPTETVYGLAADATNDRAVGRIFLAKGRPRFNPLIVHVGSRQQAEAIGSFNNDARRLAEAFWPGPLTLVVPKRSDAPIVDLATAGLETIAIRVPAHPVAQDLLAVFGGPVAAPSANRSGHVSPTTAAHVAEDLGDAVGVILDGGPAVIGIESTIVSAASDQPFLLRSGGIPTGEIEGALGRPLATPAGDHPSAPSAPGMLESHYAPSATLRLDVANVRDGEGLIAFGSALPEGADRAAALYNLSPNGDLVEAAARFFAGLRDLDRVASSIAVVPIPNEGLGEAINDRLRRAATPRPQTSDSSSRA